MQMNFDPLPTSPLMSLGLAAVAVSVLVGSALYGASVLDQRGYERAKKEDAALLQTQKLEATQLLAQETEKLAKAQSDLSKLITTMEKNRETLQAKNRIDLRSNTAGPRLQYNVQTIGCGPGSGSTQSAALGAASDPGTTVLQLPEPLNSNLWQFAADAQSLAIDYRVLWDYVHEPRLICSLQPVE